MVLDLPDINSFILLNSHFSFFGLKWFVAHNIKAPFGLRFWPLIIMWSGLWFSIFTIHNMEEWNMVNYLIHFRSANERNETSWQIIFFDNNGLRCENDYVQTILILQFDAVHCSSFTVYGAKLYFIQMSLHI